MQKFSVQHDTSLGFGLVAEKKDLALTLGMIPNAQVEYQHPVPQPSFVQQPIHGQQRGYHQQPIPQPSLAQQPIHGQQRGYHQQPIPQPSLAQQPVHGQQLGYHQQPIQQPSLAQQPIHGQQLGYHQHPIPQPSLALQPIHGQQLGCHQPASAYQHSGEPYRYRGQPYQGNLPQYQQQYGGPKVVPNASQYPSGPSGGIQIPAMAPARAQHPTKPVQQQPVNLSQEGVGGEECHVSVINLPYALLNDRESLQRVLESKGVKGFSIMFGKKGSATLLFNKPIEAATASFQLSGQVIGGRTIETRIMKPL